MRCSWVALGVQLPVRLTNVARKRVRAGVPGSVRRRRSVVTPDEVSACSLGSQAAHGDATAARRSEIAQRAGWVVLGVDVANDDLVRATVGERLALHVP